METTNKKYHIKDNINININININTSNWNAHSLHTLRRIEAYILFGGDDDDDDVVVVIVWKGRLCFGLELVVAPIRVRRLGGDYSGGCTVLRNDAGLPKNLGGAACFRCDHGEKAIEKRVRPLRAD